ncbi:alpha/beta hydrolase [Gramella sp. BOM4]|nr:alpha/beta hydrolase [Christiangramia bathymodioli]
MKMHQNGTLLLLLFFLFGYFISTAQLQEGIQIIQFNGKNVQVNSKGLNNRSEGEPIVILESGLGSPIQSWNALIQQLPDTLPVFTYERAGIGQSDQTEEAPNPEFTAERLHDILGQLEIMPPYIMVGHSWGGPLINSFAVQFPDEVAGMVFIDESDIVNMGANFLEAIKRASDGKVTTNVISEKMNTYFQMAPPGIAREWSEIYNLVNSEDLEIKRFTPTKTVPTAILLSGKYEPAPVDLGITGFDFKDFQEMLKLRAEKFTKKISDNPNAIFLQYNNLGHYMHVENPEMVAGVIAEIYPMAK